MDIPRLETARLWLRAHQPDDFEDFARMWTEPSVVRFTVRMPLSREAAWSRFLRQTGHWQVLGFGFFAIEDKATGAFVGEAGFHDLRRPLQPSLEGTMEAGWVLAGAAQGRGLAGEAMRAVIAWAEGRTTRRMTCLIDPEHAASLHVAGKLGFEPFAATTYQDRPMLLLERRR